MSGFRTALSWLEDKSDWLSPIVVKEVRQVVRGREFNYSLGVSLVAGLGVAFFGAADVLAGNTTAGRWTFAALMGCLALVGLAVVPLGAFSALRNERMEQTLELITLTALSPRRVVIGKLFAQGVKLTTLFAAIAPFIAMSFLLGGIDFLTILVSLVAVFMWSLWACAVCLLLSTLFKSRAMSGLVFGGVAILVLMGVSIGRGLFLIASVGRTSSSVMFGAGPDPWWAAAIVATACLATMANLVLLAENRLSLPTGNRVTPLRIGFLAQFLLIVAWCLTSLGSPPAARSDAVDILGVLGGLHLGLVAMFTVTEDLTMPRRVLAQLNRSSPWRRLRGLLPGGGRGAIYVLGQMALMLATARVLGANGEQMRWMLAACGYICLCTGVPAVIYRVVQPEAASLHLRVAVLLVVPATLILPDLIHYLVWRPDSLNLAYSARHLLNPLRTLGNWRIVETQSWFAAPLALGLTGLAAYFALIVMGTRLNVETASLDPEAPVLEA